MVEVYLGELARVSREVIGEYIQLIQIRMTRHAADRHYALARHTATSSSLRMRSLVHPREVQCLFPARLRVAMTLWGIWWMKVGGANPVQTSAAKMDPRVLVGGSGISSPSGVADDISRFS
jgi:hypothetical protein